MFTVRTLDAFVGAGEGVAGETMMSCHGWNINERLRKTHVIAITSKLAVAQGKCCLLAGKVADFHRQPGEYPVLILITRGGHRGYQDRSLDGRPCNRFKMGNSAGAGFYTGV